MELDKRIIDVSSYTPLTRVPWIDSRIAAGYVKISEGVSVFDRLAGAHLYAIWQAKKPAGVYHFFHPAHLAQEQFDWFVKCVEQTCWGKVGDLVPAIDLERNVVDGLPTSVWNVPAEGLYNLLSAHFGSCLVYCGLSTFDALGKPEWLVQASQWVPQWNADGYPQLAPSFIKGLGGASPVMVQNYVGPLFGSIQESTSPVAVDQSYGGNLLTIVNGVTPSEHPTIMIGSTGQEVALWQQLLNEMTDLEPPTSEKPDRLVLKIDGMFGPLTQKATESWQDGRALSITGVVDAACWQFALLLEGWTENEGCKGAVRMTIRSPTFDYQ